MQRLLRRSLDRSNFRAGTEREEDRLEFAHYFAGAPDTVKLIVVVRVSAPDVPVMVTVRVPSAALAAVPKVTVEVLAELVGEKMAVTPTGNPVALNATAPVKPFCAETAIWVAAWTALRGA